MVAPLQRIRKWRLNREIERRYQELSRSYEGLRNQVRRGTSTLESILTNIEENISRGEITNTFIHLDSFPGFFRTYNLAALYLLVLAHTSASLFFRYLDQMRELEYSREEIREKLALFIRTGYLALRHYRNYCNRVKEIIGGIYHCIDEMLARVRGREELERRLVGYREAIERDWKNLVRGRVYNYISRLLFLARISLQQREYL